MWLILALAWDTSSLDMAVRVYKEKVLLVLHLRYLDKKSLAARVYQEQLDRGWPGLGSEVEDICRELNIENANITNYNRADYKQILLQACCIRNEAILRKLAEGKEKCHRMSSEKYGIKAYIEETRPMQSVPNSWS